MKKEKILITGEVHPVMIKMFTAANFECHYEPKLSQSELEKRIGDYTGLIVRSLWVKVDLLKKTTKLKFIGRVGSGMERIDVEAAQKQGIRCFNSPEGNCEAVAEHTIGLMLALLHKITKGNHEMGQLIFDRKANSGQELSAQTVGVIGVGNVGGALVRKLSGFGCKVLGYDKYKNVAKNNFGNPNFEAVDLPFLLENSTIISLHLPETEETNQYVNEKFVKKVKRNFYLINTSRGNMLNLNDMLNFLQIGKILGLALDVFPIEPPLKLAKMDLKAYHYLTELSDNVIMTPHSAGLTEQSFYKLSQILAEKVLQSR